MTIDNLASSSQSMIFHIKSHQLQNYQFVQRTYLTGIIISPWDSRTKTCKHAYNCILFRSNNTSIKSNQPRIISFIAKGQNLPQGIEFINPNLQFCLHKQFLDIGTFEVLIFLFWNSILHLFSTDTFEVLLFRLLTLILVNFNNNLNELGYFKGTITFTIDQKEYQ